MTQADLSLVLEWAASEGWNPGVDDAAAFFAADREGFFLNEVDGHPVAAVSVVNHSDDFAFLGLYLCHPEFRGRGYGYEVWQAGLAHAGSRCVGLDGVPAQQANYERSGFSRQGRTIRYQGRISSNKLARATSSFDREEVIEADRLAAGFFRRRYAEAWVTDTETRRTLSLDPASPGKAFATFRVCREGVKIGPFHADDFESAEVLLDSVPAEFGDGPLFLDIPDSAAALADLVVSRGFEPVFETTRMYSAESPAPKMPGYYAVTTLELG